MRLTNNGEATAAMALFNRMTVCNDTFSGLRLIVWVMVTAEASELLGRPGGGKEYQSQPRCGIQTDIHRQMGNRPANAQ